MEHVPFFCGSFATSCHISRLFFMRKPEAKTNIRACTFSENILPDLRCHVTPKRPWTQDKAEGEVPQFMTMVMMNLLYNANDKHS
jgi:hypothetical protein